MVNDHPCKYEWEECPYPPAPGRAYCGPHLEPPHPHGIGHGQPVGPQRPDYPDRYYDLQCDLCKATWVGPIHEPCDWCETSLHHMQLWQAELVLTAPDVGPDDQRHPDAMRAWAERLAVAAKAELITPGQAEQAWKRAVTR